MKHVKHIILHLVFDLWNNLLTSNVLLAVDLVILNYIKPATHFLCVHSINIVILHLLTVKLVHTAEHLAANLVLKLVLPHHVVPLMLLLELV